MRMRTFRGTLVLAAGLVACSAGAGDDGASASADASADASSGASSEVKSGPQAGEPHAGTFDVNVVTGEQAGEKLCFT